MYCKNCGTKLNDNASFCKVCGNRIKTAMPQQARVEQKMKYCVKCGKQIRAEARFCNHCGYSFDKKTDPGLSRVSSNTFVGNAASRVGAAAATAIRGNFTQKIAASTMTGEMNLGAFGDNIAPSVLGMAGSAGSAIRSLRSGANQILSPGNTFINGIKGFFGNIVNTLKDPKALITVLAMAILWLVLGFMRDSDSGIVKALSWLTYSEGGLDRSYLGILGGMFGKGAVAAMFASLVQGGGKSVISGVKNMFRTFSGKEGKLDIVSLIIGIIIGIAGYFIFVGFFNASAGSAMAGIAGTVLSLKALGDKSSFLYRISTSIFSKVQNGIRVLQGKKVESLISGVSLGFAFITSIFAVVN